MRCFICKGNFGSINTLFVHLRHRHGLYDEHRALYKCGQGVCSRTFSSFSGYRRHLKTHHNEHRLELLPAGEPAVGPPILLDQDIQGDEVDQNDAADDEVPMDDDLPILSPEEIQRHACAFIGNFSSRPTIPETCVNDIVNSANSLMETIVNSAAAAVAAAFTNHGLPPESPALDQIQSHLSILQNPFEDLNSDYKRMKYCRSNGMVQPREISLGLRYENRLSKETKQIQQVAVNDTFTYVPILETLESLVKHPDVLYHVTHQHTSNDGVMRDFCDCQLFDEIDLFNEDPNALQLQFFYDDFVTVNPLGSKTIHKLGAFYFVLKNLPLQLIPS